MELGLLNIELLLISPCCLEVPLKEFLPLVFVASFLLSVAFFLDQSTIGASFATLSKRGTCRDNNFRTRFNLLSSLLTSIGTIDFIDIITNRDV